MRKILFIVLLICLVGCCQALTVSENIRFNSSVEAGHQYIFTSKITPDLNEKNITMSVTSKCPFVATDKQSLLLNQPATLKTTINVPLDSVNGWKRCDVTLGTPPVAGNVNYNIGIPISIDIHNGTGIKPTEVPTQIVPTPTIENKPTVIPVATPSVTKTIAPLAQQEVPQFRAVTFIGIGIGIFAVTLIAIFVVRKFKSEPEDEVVNL